MRPIVNTVPSLCRGLEMDFVSNRLNVNDPGLINVIVFVMELPMLEIPDLSDVLPSLCNLIVSTTTPIASRVENFELGNVVVRKLRILQSFPLTDKIPYGRSSEIFSNPSRFTQGQPCEYLSFENHHVKPTVSRLNS